MLFITSKLIAKTKNSIAITLRSIKEANAQLHYHLGGKPERMDIAFEIYYETGEKPSQQLVNKIYEEALVEHNKKAYALEHTINVLNQELNALQAILESHK